MKRVVAALIEQNDSVLLTRRKEGQSNAGFWEFPGGKIEAGETPEESLAREIAEELGIEIQIGPFVASNQFQYKDFKIELLAYLAHSPHGELTLSVHDCAAWVSPENLLSYRLTPADVPIAEHYLQQKAAAKTRS
jgi:mutator protein MutT